MQKALASCLQKKESDNEIMRFGASDEGKGLQERLCMRPAAACVGRSTSGSGLGMRAVQVHLGGLGSVDRIPRVLHHLDNPR